MGNRAEGTRCLFACVLRVCPTVRAQLYFLAAAFLAAGLALGAAAAFFGFGALGFFVGGLALFLAFGAAALLPLAGVEGFLAAGFFLAAAAFLSLLAAVDFGLDGDEAAAAAAFFALPEEAAADAFLVLAEPEAAAALGVDLAAAGFFADEDFDSSLNDPEAPLPFVWIRAPDSTALFKYFLMNGASFSASTLYWAAMYFLMACSEDPLRSLSSLMALFTISEVLGCVGFALGFLAPPAAAEAFGFFAGVAGAGASAATAVSAIFLFVGLRTTKTTTTFVETTTINSVRSELGPGASGAI